MREDWIDVKLGDLLKLKNGFAFKANNYINEGIPVFRIGDINDWAVSSENAVKIAENSVYDDYQVEQGDILIAMSGATTGKFGIYHSNEKAYQNQRVGNLKLYSENSLNKKFIFYLLYSLKRDIEREAYGGAQPNISGVKIEALNTKLAPLPIQRAIVSKIEALFSDLDNGIANFKKAQEQLKIYRQAVLKKAFEGELTKEWREKQTNLPTAEELLKQIKEERQNHYNQQIEDWKKAVKEWEKNGKNGKKPSKPRKLKELSPFSEDELSEFAQLPKSWIWSKVDKIIDHNTHSIKAGPFGSSLKKSFYVEAGYKIYGQEQVISGNHKYGDYYVNEKKFQELISCAIKPKDALISLVGTVGKVLILPDDCEQGIINPRLIKISFNNFYSPTFFKYYFESAYLKSMYAHKSHGATMDIITLGIIQELPFPLFSLQEQIQIVQEIESRLSVCDKMEQSITESIVKAEALRQSILKKAFEGKLLSEAEIAQCKQAADYEPASELLKKIQADKLAKEQEQKKANTKKKSKK